MARLGSSAAWRHVVVGAVVIGGPVLALAGCLGRKFEPEGFDAKQILVQPAGEDGVRIRETVDQDFGTFGKHGYERSIPNDFGEPIDIEASSPDAPDAVSAVPDPDRRGNTRIRIGDPATTVSGQHRYVLSYTLPAADLSSGSLFLDIIDPGEPFATDDFEVVVTGLRLDDPHCARGSSGATGGCELVADGDLYRAELGRLDTDEGVTISGGITGRLEAPPVDEPPLPDRREDPSTAPLAAAMLPIGVIGAGAVFAVARRRGRNEVYAGGAADAAFGATTLPPPGSPPLAVTYVADDRMDELATTEFEPPRGIAPWQGQVLITERINSDTTSAWFSGHAARDVLSITKDDDDHVVLAPGPRFAHADPADLAVLQPLFGGGDTVVLDGYDKDFATAWTGAQTVMKASTASSGWWRSRSPGGRSTAETMALGCLGTVGLIVLLAIIAVLSLALGPPGAIAFAIVVPAAVAFLLYRYMLPSRSAAGSALALRTESFRRFLQASEGQHVEWAWSHGLLREYSAWAVALGAADAWERAMQRSSVPPAEMSMGPLLVYSMAPSFSSAHTAPSSTGGGGGGGFSGGVGGGGGGGSSGSW
jgi:uncharacterized membrane protein YgcG